MPLLSGTHQVLVSNTLLKSTEQLLTGRKGCCPLLALFLAQQMPTNAKTCPEVTLFTTGTIAFAVYWYCVTSPSHSRLAALHTNYFVILKVALAIGLLSSEILPNSQEEQKTKTIFLPIPEDKKKCCVSFSAVCWSGFLFPTRFILLDLASLFSQRDLLLP